MQDIRSPGLLWLDRIPSTGCCGVYTSPCSLEAGSEGRAFSACSGGSSQALAVWPQRGFVLSNPAIVAEITAALMYNSPTAPSLTHFRSRYARPLIDPHWRGWYLRRPRFHLPTALDSLVTPRSLARLSLSLATLIMRRGT